MQMYRLRIILHLVARKYNPVCFKLMERIVRYMCGTISYDSTLCVQQTAEQWRLVFLIAAGMQVVTGGLFLAFGSAELQTWNSPASSAATDDVVERTEPLVKSSKKRPIVKK